MGDCNFSSAYSCNWSSGDKDEIIKDVKELLEKVNDSQYTRHDLSNIGSRLSKIDSSQEKLLEALPIALNSIALILDTLTRIEKRVIGIHELLDKSQEPGSVK